MKREKLEAIINDERSSDITKITAELALKDMKIDTIERRIKRQSTCIELWHKVNEDLQGKNSRMRERIKELEDELQVANRCTEDARERIKELEEELKMERSVREDVCAEYWKLRTSQPTNEKTSVVQPPKSED